VEAPTAGSVILAGLLLKLGTYGFLRFSLTMFPYGCVYFKPLVYTLCILAVVYTSMTTIRQIDLKKIIAYSSIGHMNFVILGLFTSNLQGLAGSIYLMLSHGIVSSALFICVGLLYDRYHTRIIFYYRGLVQFMPLFAILFFFFSIANVSFPGTSSFVGELLILLGLFEHNVFITVLACLGVIFGVIYSFWLYNRIIFGNSHKVLDKYLLNHIYADLSKREFLILLVLAFFVLLGGFFPNIFLNYINACLYNYVELYLPLYYELI
jgi:proton-translocating NADH-quinone oxidoreductase chain M